MTRKEQLSVENMGDLELDELIEEQRRCLPSWWLRKRDKEPTPEPYRIPFVVLGRGRRKHFSE